MSACMRTHAGVAAQMMQALADQGINIELICTSEIKVTLAIPRDRADDAQKAVHAAFGLGKKA